MPDIIRAQLAEPKPTSKRLSSKNLWRDGHQLVVLGDEFVFPECCVMTGSQQNIGPVFHTVNHLPNSLYWQIMFGTLGALFAQARFGTRLDLCLPVSNDWLGKRKRNARRGVRIAVGSGAVLLLSVIGIFYFDPREEVIGQLLMIPLLLAQFTGIGALIYLAFAGTIDLLKCYRMDRGCTWLHGASPAFLAHLPDWSTAGPPGYPGVLRR